MNSKTENATGMNEPNFYIEIGGVKRGMYLFEGGETDGSKLIIYKAGSLAIPHSERKLSQPLVSKFIENNISVLYYNDRGVEENDTESLYYSVGLEEFGDDLRQIVAQVNQASGKKYEKIGLCGHSEGGLISMIAASGNPDVSFVVLLATPFVKMYHNALFRESMLMKVTVEELRSAKMLYYKQRYALFQDGGDWEELYDQYRTIYEIKERLNLGSVPDIRKEFEKERSQFDKPYYYSQYRADVETWFPTIECPIYSIVATEDQNIDPVANAVWLSELANKYKKNVDISIIAGLDHLFVDRDDASRLDLVVNRAAKWLVVNVA